MHTCIPSLGLKDPDILVIDELMPATKKHTQHASSMQMECDYLYGRIKKRTQKSNENWWTAEMQLGMQKKKRLIDWLVNSGSV